MTGVDKEIINNYKTAVKYMRKKKWIGEDARITTMLMSEIMLNQTEKAGVSEEIKNMLKSFAFSLEYVSMDPVLESFTKTVTEKLDNIIEAGKQKVSESIERSNQFINVASTKYGELITTMTDATKALKEAARDEVSNYKEKLNKALGKMEDATRTERKIINLRLTRANTTLLEMNGAEAARWLRSGENWKGLVREAFGQTDKDDKVVPRTYPVVIKFAPVGWSPHEEEALRKFEADNAIPTNSIQAVAWIKNPVYRYTGQAFANVKMVTSSPEVANRLILGPTRIESHVVRAQKEWSYIPICAKCSQFDHFIAKCKADKYKCRFCTQEHESKDCSNRTRMKCTPCRSEGYISGNERCIKYRERREAIETKVPELSSVKYEAAN
ncbi:hypothetical protein PIIN_10518 [Serendipita indica DSM 11827]|uniref:Uncharacterized protein n=1 Tax=Serendipita indica (strain DSM 11827) TaxID=1109443 RepID=G4TYY2_SERID|nr:hypothetical protein PIIN_10518 [Serendipita indica DSM 11827]